MPSTTRILEVTATDPRQVYSSLRFFAFGFLGSILTLFISGGQLQSSSSIFDGECFGHYPQRPLLCTTEVKSEMASLCQILGFLRTSRIGISWLLSSARGGGPSYYYCF